jgi:hypothetical protein
MTVLAVHRSCTTERRDGAGNVAAGEALLSELLPPGRVAVVHFAHDPRQPPRQCERQDGDPDEDGKSRRLATDDSQVSEEG